MSETLGTIFSGVLERLHTQATTHLPSLIAAGVIFVVAFVMAVFVRALIVRLFKGATIDRFLRKTGLAFMMDPTGGFRATRIASEGAYWIILIAGALNGLSVFGTDLTAQLIEDFVLLIPKLIVAGVILLSGTWLSQYLSRCTLVWAFNEGLPYPKRLGVAVRVVVLFVAVVVAADHLDFARSVFLAAFIMFMSGLILTVSLAFGLGSSATLRQYLESKRKNETSETEEERSLWTHL